MNDQKLSFASDYMEGAHPAILRKLSETNLIKSPGYGLDPYSESAREKIRSACGAPDAEVYFLSGGTQTNATMLDAMLAPYQGVVAAVSGHISTHEAGAIEFTGHKVLTLPEHDGKLRASDVESLLKNYHADENRDHTVMPGAVYVSHPTESGTLYSKEELASLSLVCRTYGVRLYLDGARLAYALGCPENDLTLRDLASLTDVFYIGGTKCGALFGEAVVIPKRGLIPHLFTIVKQHGALLAKGRIAGIQFETLFTDGLYEALGRSAVEKADRIRAALREKRYEFAFDSPTNQIFVALTPAQKEALLPRVEMSFWEERPDGKTVYRIAASWATEDRDVDALIAVL